MRNDIVTFFGPRDHGGLLPYLHQSESKSWFAYSVGDLSNSRDTDRIKVLQQGGVVVQVDYGASDVPGVVIGTWKGASYEPPGKLLVLHLDRSPEWVDLKPGTKEIALEPGSHVLLPLDCNSELALENLRRGLEYLPLDYEITVLNVLRRPSLEWRVSRLERAVRSEQPVRHSVAVGAETSALNSLLRWRKISLVQVAAILLLLVLSTLVGYFLFSGRSDPPKTQQPTKTANQFTGKSPAVADSKSGGSPGNMHSVIPDTGEKLRVQQATATTIQSSVAASFLGNPVTFTATVTGVNGSFPAGSVQFMDGKRLIGTRKLNASGVAILTAKQLRAGPHQIQALYLGDAGFRPSKSEVVSQTVNTIPAPVKLETQTTLKIPKDRGKAQRMVEVEVTCVNSDTIPTGEVQIDKGDGMLDRKTLSNGIADFDIASFGLKKGSYMVTATYLGGPGFRGSVSRSATLQVK